MLIALCLFKYFPYGGLQRDFMAIGKELHKRGHKVRVYTRTWQGEKPEEFEIILTPVRAFTNHGANVKYYHWVKKHLELHPVDVVVGFNKIPDLDIYYAADVCYAEQLMKENKSFIYKISPRCKHFLNFERSVFSKESKTEILALTETQKADFQKHYQTDESRIHILPPGISRDRHYTNLPKDGREILLRELKLDSDHKLCLQIGSDFYRKGVDRSIQALASLPIKLKDSTHLIILGQDNPKYFISLAKKYKIENQIHFLSGRKDVPTFLAGCDIFLHPARSESAGIAILEALIGGLPEIVTDVCGYAHYVNEAKSGIVLESPFNLKNFINALTFSLNNNNNHLWKQNATSWADSHDMYLLHSKAADIILNKISTHT